MASKAGGAAKPGRVWLRRLAWGAGTVALLTFAIEGGEYGTRDLLVQRREHRALELELEALRDSVEALTTRPRAAACRRVA